MNGEYEDPVDAIAELFAEVDPQPTSEFVDRLETQLRIAHARPGRDAAPGRGWGRLGGLAAVAVVVLAAATAGLVWNDRSVSSALEMTNAIGVKVTLPDGSTVEDPDDGFDLPEGAVIVVRIGGSVTIDDVSLEEGSTVMVRDGELITEVEIITSTAPPPEPTGRLDQPSDAELVPGPADAPEPSASYAPSPSIDEPAMPSPRDDPPGKLPKPEPPAPAQHPAVPGIDPSRPAPPHNPQKSGPTVTIEPRPIGPPITIESPSPVPPAISTELGLSVRRHANTRKVVLRWSTGPGIDPQWRTVAIRSSADAQPDWPLGPGSVALGEAPAGTPGHAVDDVPADMAAVSYRVVMLDSAGSVVARGAVQSVILG